MKNLLLTLLFCLVALSVLSQSSNAIHGKVLDASTPVEFANVLLFAQNDSIKIVKNAVTDSTGAFVLEGLATGAYMLKVQIMGYLPYSMRVSLMQESLDLGSIALLTDAKVLQTAVVTAQKAVIQKTPQGFIFDAAATLTQVGGTATDLLRSTPTVVVDAEGAVTLRGKTPLILINGRNSNLSNTDLIPASSIESIEIINNPSAQYDADAEGGIINIRLKKSQKNGTNGAVAMGAGYGAKGRINSSVLLNHKAGKWNIGLAYDNRFAGRVRKGYGDRVNFRLPDQYYLTQRRIDDRTEGDQNLRLNLDYALNAKNVLGFEAIGNLEDEANDENLANLIETQSRQFDSRYSRRSIELSKGKVAELAFLYRRKFEDERKKLTASASTSLNDEQENTDITNQELTASNTASGDPFLQRTHNYQNTSVSNIQLDFAQPVSERGAIETGYKGIVRRLNTDFQSQDKTSDTYVTNPQTSNIFDYREQIHAAYAQYSGFSGPRENPAWKYSAGLRAEQVWGKGSGQDNTLKIDNSYFNLFSTANVAWYLRPDEFLKASYGRRINRPGLGQLNPFTDVTDSLTQRGGNPNLQPELVHSFEIGYNKDWEKTSFSTVLFYRRANNAIRPFTLLRPDGVLFTQPLNFGSFITYGSETILTAYFSPFWDANVSFSVFQQKIDGSNVGAEVANEVFSWYGKIINNVTLWKGGKLQVLGNYNSPIATPQGRRIAIYNADIGFQQKTNNGKGRLGLIVTDVFNTQRNGFLWETPDFTFSRIFKVDTRAILLTFAYAFGTASFKEKLMENKFSND